MRYPDNCSPRKIVPRLGLEFGSRLGLVLGFKGNHTIAPEENSPSARVRVSVRVSFGFGEQFSSGAIVYLLWLCSNVKETFFILHINYIATFDWIKLLRLKQLTLHSVEISSGRNSSLLFVIVFWGETNRSRLSQMKFLLATLLKRDFSTGVFLWNLRNF